MEVWSTLLTCRASRRTTNEQPAVAGAYLQECLLAQLAGVRHHNRLNAWWNLSQTHQAWVGARQPRAGLATPLRIMAMREGGHEWVR
eukprot:5702785-Pyramimonas_sp.AAC.1